MTTTDTTSTPPAIPTAAEITRARSKAARAIWEARARITIGTAYFTRTAAQLTESLFSPNGTASGTFRKHKHRLTFCAPTGAPFAALVANPDQAPFFVSCADDNGRTRYAYALSSADAQRLGFAGLTYNQEAALALKTWKTANA